MDHSLLFFLVLDFCNAAFFSTSRRDEFLMSLRFLTASSPSSRDPAALFMLTLMSPYSESRPSISSSSSARPVSSPMSSSTTYGFIWRCCCAKEMRML